MAQLHNCGSLGMTEAAAVFQAAAMPVSVATFMLAVAQLDWSD